MYVIKCHDPENLLKSLMQEWKLKNNLEIPNINYNVFIPGMCGGLCLEFQTKSINSHTYRCSPEDHLGVMYDINRWSERERERDKEREIEIEREWESKDSVFLALDDDDDVDYSLLSRKTYLLTHWMCLCACSPVYARLFVRVCTVSKTRIKAKL